ncbi:histidine kinase [Paenibacillus sp. 32O-W]|uniref:Spo0B domain-containing protein n=1 Tax=Paenibacillus sp. 32O-W TaxID=1695218 RepID=UPI000720F3E7|nr:Spo0B domain-containing protein [Paenibacillus sp. 32O-W]ALS27004.1 histidine kinase [Paenibacillus sp. 32O-W]
MIRWETAKYYAAGSVLLPAAGVLLWPSARWMNAVFAGWLLLAAAFWIFRERREQAERLERTIQAMQIASIRTLNHHRHDWMNDLQVLYGYIRLQKQDKMAECVEKIRERMAMESKIAKLGEPSLVIFLQSFRTMTHSLRLNVRIDGELNFGELPFDGAGTAAALIDVLNAYRFAVKPGSGEAAALTLALSRDDKSLIVELDVDGEVQDARELQRKLKQRLKGTPLQPVNLDHPEQYAKLTARFQM